MIPRESETPVEGYDLWQNPQLGYQERVYYHEDIITDSSNIAKAVIRNPRFPLQNGDGHITVTLSWSLDHLPRLVQWKMPGQGIHVLGIEPANCYVEGRVAERKRGTLITLDPGESHTHELELEIDIEA